MCVSHRLLCLVLGTTLSACAGGDLTLPSDSAPIKLSVVSGDGQEARVGTKLPDPLVVRLTDAAARPVAHVPLSFRFQADVPDASIEPATVETDTTGLASVEVRLGSTVGPQVVEARSLQDASLSVSFAMTAVENANRGHGGGGGEGGGD